MRSGLLRGRFARALMGLVLLGSCAAANRALALDFDFKPPLASEEVKGVLNTTFTAGLGVRTQSPSINLIPKSYINPDVCTVPYQSCQGLFRTQTFMAQHLTAAPG